MHVLHDQGPGRRQTQIVPRFIVLAKADDSDRTLAAEDQRTEAERAGFTVAEFSIEATTRGFAHRAWDAHRSGRDVVYAGESDDDAFGLESLTEPELTAVVALVVALVEQDRPTLDAAGAYDWPNADPYTWTRDYGRWGQVDLIVPPGDPHHWSGGVGPRGDITGVVVDMWTRQEGPSDLSLEVELTARSGEGLGISFGDLHVL